MKTVFVPIEHSQNAVDIRDIPESTTIFVKRDSKLIGMLNREYSELEEDYKWVIAKNGKETQRDQKGKKTFSTRFEAALAAQLVGLELVIEE